MKKVKLIYNPYSGENVILSKLDDIIDIHQQAGFTIVPYRIRKGCSIEGAFTDMRPGEYEYMVISNFCNSGFGHRHHHDKLSFNSCSHGESSSKFEI